MKGDDNDGIGHGKISGHTFGLALAGGHLPGFAAIVFIGVFDIEQVEPFLAGKFMRFFNFHGLWDFLQQELPVIIDLSLDTTDIGCGEMFKTAL